MPCKQPLRLPLYLAAVLLMLSMIPACVPAPVSKQRTAPDKEREYLVLNTLAESLSVYHPDTGRLYNNELITGSMPNDLLYYDGGDIKKIFIVCSGDNSVEVYSEASFLHRKSIYLGPNNNPYAIIPGPDAALTGGRPLAFVTNWMSDTVSVIDLDQEERVETLEDNSLDAPQGGTVMGSWLFICNSAYSGGTETRDGTVPSFGDGTVSIFELGGEGITPVTAISTGQGSNPQSCLGFPDRDELHVYLSGSQDDDDGRVLILDTAPLADGNPPSEITTLAIGGSPKVSKQAYDADTGRVFLTGTWGLYYYNAHTASLPDPPANPVLPSGDPASDLYSGLALADGSRLFLTVFHEDRLLIIDSETFEEINGLACSDGPLSIHYSGP